MSYTGRAKLSSSIVREYDTLGTLNAPRTRACDYHHHLLLLPFILSNLFREEVDELEHNRHHSGSPVVDPSEELIGVTNLFLRWYKLSRVTSQGKTAADIGTLQALSLR